MVIAIANQKGGVAKSTTAINLSAGLAQAGHKVLLIDIDPQGNTTQVFIHPQVELELERTLYNPLINFAPSHIRLSGVDLELAQVFDNRSERLNRAMETIRRQYDYIIIDNPPSLGLLTINAFVAADRLLIPVSTAYFALTGLVQLQESITMVRQTQLNPDLGILGVLCTFADHTNVSRDVQRQLREYFGELVFQTVIPKNVSLEEAHSNHVPIFEHAPQSSGAIAYKALVKEVVQR